MKFNLNRHIKFDNEDHKGGGGGGNEDPKWYDGLPEDVRSHQEILNTPDLETAAKRIIDQAAFASRSIRIPGEDASEEDRTKFYERIIKDVPDLMRTPESGSTDIYTRLGKPDEVDGYKPPEREGVNFDNDQTKAFREIAHKNNLTQAQFEGIVSDMTDLNLAAEARFRETTDASIKKLSDEWGPAYGQRANMIKQFVDLTNAPSSVKKLVEAGKAGYETMTWLYSLTKQLGGEGGALKIQPQGGSHEMSSSEAKNKIAEIRGNKEHPYWDKSSGQAHLDARKKMRELYKIAYPEG